MAGLQLTPKQLFNTDNRRNWQQWRVPPGAQVKQGLGDRSSAADANPADALNRSQETAPLESLMLLEVRCPKLAVLEGRSKLLRDHDALRLRFVVLCT